MIFSNMHSFHNGMSLFFEIAMRNWQIYREIRDIAMGNGKLFENAMRNGSLPPNLVLRIQNRQKQHPDIYTLHVSSLLNLLNGRKLAIQESTLESRS